METGTHDLSIPLASLVTAYGDDYGTEYRIGYYSLPDVSGRSRLLRSVRGEVAHWYACQQVGKIAFPIGGSIVDLAKAYARQQQRYGAGNQAEASAFATMCEQTGCPTPRYVSDWREPAGTVVMFDDDEVADDDIDGGN